MHRLSDGAILFGDPDIGIEESRMTERRLRFQFICGFTGDLVRVYETPAQAVARGLREPAAEYGYVERFSYEEARELLGAELEDVERRLGDHK